MKKLSAFVLSLSLMAAVSTGCTTTEKGAVVGAAGGALVGQAIGGNTKSTLIGAAVGTVAGAMIGASMDRPGYCRYRDRNGVIYEAPCPK